MVQIIPIPAPSRISRLLALLFCILLPIPVLAASSPWSVHVWQSSDGLPNNDIVGISQSPDGYLNVATLSGLVRFDGVQFDRVPISQLRDNPNSHIRASIESPTGDLWLAYDNGLIAQLPRNAQPQIFNTGINHSPDQIALDKDGALWITYAGGPLCRLKNGKTTLFDTPDGVPPGRYGSLISDAHGTIWLARGGQIGSFHDDHFHSLFNLHNDNIRLTLSSNSDIWICSHLHLLKYTGSSELQDLGNIPANNPASDPTSFLEDPSGALWIGTTYSGLFRYDGHAFENVPTSFHRISCLSADPEGNVWVGTFGGGLDRVRPRAVQVDGSDTGLSVSAIVSLCQDTSGKIWAASEDGSLLAYTDSSFTPVQLPELSGMIISCVDADPAGGIWIGTRNRQLRHYLNGRFTIFSPSDGLAEHNINALLVTKSGDVWLAEERPDEALQCLHNNRFSTFTLDPSVRHIHVLTQDAAGTIWAGSDSGTLISIKDPHATPTLIRPLDATVRALYPTPNGALWIGYSTGFARLKNNKFSPITTDNGLFCDNILQILHDDRGWLWFGSDRGIFKVRQQQLDDIADAPNQNNAKPAQSVRYGSDEELPHLQASPGASPSAIRTRDGRLWMPMGMALAIISPDKVHENLQPPPVFITHLTIDDQTPIDLTTQSPAAAIKLPPNHRRVQFDFTALSLTAPENVRFRYRLEGFETNWNDASTDRFAKYSHLSAGNYKFHVVACNDAGIWNDAGATFTFSVQPFFWQTWWFWTAALLCFTTAVVLIARFVSFRRLRSRLHALEKQTALHKERARIARDLHDDLGGSLTHISLLLDLAQRTPPERLNGQLHKISSTMSDVSESIDEIVWAINPRNDSLPNLINYLGQYALEFLRAADVRCRLDLPDHPPKIPLTPEIRHNVFLVVKEALSNVVHHAHATEVQLRISIETHSVTLTIEDNGKGLSSDTNSAPGADGLHNMHQRLTEIHGQLKILSLPKAGTQITLTFPTPQLT